MIVGPETNIYQENSWMIHFNTRYIFLKGLLANIVYNIVVIFHFDP